MVESSLYRRNSVSKLFLYWVAIIPLEAFDEDESMYLGRFHADFNLSTSRDDGVEEQQRVDRPRG